MFAESGSAWGNMTQTAKLTASDGAAEDRFGYSVSTSGSTLAVGSPSATIGSNTAQGATYLFTESRVYLECARPDRQVHRLRRPVGRLFRLLDGDQRQHAGTRSPSAMVGNNSGQGAAYVFVQPPVVTGIARSAGPASGGTTVTITGKP